jgi:GntR family transcriptional regulator
MTIGYGPVPPYRQLAALLREQITSGQIQPGQTIPSKRTLRELHDIGANTIDKAISLLKAEGLVETSLGLGIFVRPREKWQLVEEPETGPPAE